MSLKRNIATWIWRTWGWSVEGPLPYDVPKCVVVVYPHTSNWDFPVGLLFREVYQVKIDFVAKHTLFKGPLGMLMRALGGKPVVRVGNTKFVDAVAAVFRQNPVFRLCVTPEGTRSHVTELRTGYHHMARAAGVPIVWSAFHWDSKVMRWSEPFFPDENYARTLEAFHTFFQGTEAHTPSLAYPIPPSAPN